MRVAVHETNIHASLVLGEISRQCGVRKYVDSKASVTS